MSFLDRLRGNKNKTEEKTQTKAEPKVKSESEKHDGFCKTAEGADPEHTAAAIVHQYGKPDE